MKLNLVYITARDKNEAGKIGKELVKKKLAACVNIIDNINSIYRWQKKIEFGKEAILIVKIKEAMVDEVIEKVKMLHSYSCPCIISLPILSGNKEYLNWIQDETK